MNEKKTVSVGLRPTRVLKSLPQSGGTTRSSPAHSKYCSAPCFIHTLLPQAASFLYAATFFLATGITNPSTYDMSVAPSQKIQMRRMHRAASLSQKVSFRPVSDSMTNSLQWQSFCTRCINGRVAVVAPPNLAQSVPELATLAKSYPIMG